MPDSPYSQVRQRLISSAVNIYTDYLSEVFDTVDDDLFQQANNSAHTVTEQNRLFDAIRSTRIKRKLIFSLLSDQLDANFSAPTHKYLSAESAPPLHSGNLLRPDNDTLEIDIAARDMTQMLPATLATKLADLRQLLAVLWPEFNPAEHLLPIDPGLLIQQFTESLTLLDLASKDKLQILKRYGRGLAPPLTNIAAVTTQILGNSRITGTSKETEQTFDAGKIRPVSHHAGIISASSMNIEAAPLPSTTEQNTTEISFSELRQVLSLGSDRPSFSTKTNRSELLTRLAALQLCITDNLFDTHQQATLALRQTLDQCNRNATDTKSQLSATDKDALDLVMRLFGFIDTDPNIAPPVRRLIAHLQIPIARSVLKDVSFFTHPQNPARALLDLLITAGTGWMQVDEYQKDRLYGEIYRIVGTIVAMPRAEPSIYPQLLGELQEFLTSEERRTRIIEQRTKEAERGRIKSRMAQLAVDNHLKRQLRQFPVPESLRPTIIQGWSRFMFLSYLKDDKENRWSSARETLDSLLWCLQPLASDEDRASWTKKVPIVLRQIKNGLQEVSYSPERIDQMLDEIKASLALVFRSTERQSSAHTHEPLADDTKMTTPVDTEIAPDEAAFVHQIQNMAIGQWVEFHLLNNNQFRCRLATHIEEGDRYLFVNRSGLKVLDKSGLELARELKAKRLSLISTEPAVDRAMRGILASLRHTTGKQA